MNRVVAGGAAGALALAGCSMDSCFVRGTRVLTPNGFEPIESLGVGDEIVSYSLSEKRTVRRAVLAVHRAIVRETRRVEVAGGVVIAGVTPTHPMYSLEAEAFLPAGRLVAGSDVALFRDGAPAVLARVTAVVATEHPTPDIEVWNLSVDGPDQTYFADGVLVHNKTYLAPYCATDHVKIEVVPVDEPAGKYAVRVTLSDPKQAGAENFSVYEGNAKICEKPQATNANTWTCALPALAKGKHDVNVSGAADTVREYCTLERTLTVEVK